MNEDTRNKYNPEKLVGTFLGKYELKEFIRETNKKWLFKGKHPGLDVDICAKVYKPHVALTSFLGEVKNLKELNHPNIEQIFDAGVEDDLHYLISRWRDMENFRELIDSGVKFSLDETGIISRTILGALDYADKKGCPHTDSKLENFGLDVNENLSLEDRVWVGDFEPWYKGEWGPGQRDYKIRNHVSGTALVIEELLNNRKNPKIEVPRGFIKVIEKAKQMKYKSPGEFKTAIENYEKGIITRRKFIKWSAGLAAAGTIVGVPSYFVIKNHNYKNSIDYIVDEIKKVEATDYKNIDPLLDELDFRTHDIKIRWLIEKIKESTAPFATDLKGKFYPVGINHYISGPWYGILCKAYEKTNEEIFIEKAKKGMDKMEIKDSDYNSFSTIRFFHAHAKAYEVTKDRLFKEKALNAAEIMLKRFNNQGNFIQLTNKLDLSPSPKTLDMATMTYCLPLLMWASKELEGEDPAKAEEFYKTAKKHTETVIKYCRRPDGSTRSLVIFDPVTKEIIEEQNPRGIAPHITFARSHATLTRQTWEMYQLRGEEIFLKETKSCIDYYVKEMERFRGLEGNSHDFISFCDFGDPKIPDTLKDTATTIFMEKPLLGANKEELINEKDRNTYKSLAYEGRKSLAINHLSPSLREDTEGIINNTCLSINGQYKNCSWMLANYFFLDR